MYTVIGFPRARTGRVIAMLEELEQSYELIPSLPHAEDVLALAPTGKIPILKDGDAVLTESVAICQYLADKHKKLTFAAGTLERARQDAFTQRIVDTIEGALWTAGKHSFVLPKDKRVPSIKPTVAWEFDRAIRQLAEAMGDGPWLMGEEFTVPDVLMTHAAAWARSAKFELPDEVIGDYVRRLESRPAWQRARERGERAMAEARG